jgi:hypothetical protein
VSADRKSISAVASSQGGTAPISIPLVSTSGAKTITAPAPVVSQPGTRLFTGDYITGDFSQWNAIHNRYVNNTGVYYDTQGWQYPATIVTDPVKGPVARMEVRQGDPGIYQAGGPPRSEVSQFGIPQMSEGNVNWQAFSTKFDPSWPLVSSDAVWALTNQWHSDVDGSPPIAFVCVSDGLWTLRINKSDGQPNANFVDIWSTPLAVGTWHDVKMQVGWSTSDTTGFIRLWHNGAAQTFVNGQTIYNIRTLIPNAGNNYYKEGIYRADRPETAVAFHFGYHYATTESAL